MTCFIKCPDYTVENEEENPPYTFSCNKEIDAYWYKFEQGEQMFYVCGVKACPVSNGDGSHDRLDLI